MEKPKIGVCRFDTCIELASPTLRCLEPSYISAGARSSNKCLSAFEGSSDTNKISDPWQSFEIGH